VLVDKVCVITGAGQGIGRAVAIEMARGGARVVASGISVDKGHETVRLIEQAGGQACYVPCDVRRRDQVQALMDGAGERYGRIDVLISNAGAHESALAPDTRVDLISDATWDAVYEINLRGTWWCTKYAAPYLRRSTAGAIVNVGSVASFVGYPMSACYSATKGAIAQLTKATATDLAADGIRCNCVCPGPTNTAQLSNYIDAAEDKQSIMNFLTGTLLVERLGRPGEVAKLMCFLASEDASFITGAVYLIDGGALAWRGTRE
jgi:NAD(P)-dependent dehydrogenase (short-subunit alcohol dehydrogenase family)